MAEEGFKCKLAAIFSADVKEATARIQVSCAQNPKFLANLSQNSVSTIRRYLALIPFTKLYSL